MKGRTGLNIAAGFIEPMLCLAVDKRARGSGWQYEVKFDGYQAIGVRMKTGVEFWCRNRKDFSRRFRNVGRALEARPNETVLDGEIVAVNGDREPSFGSPQNFRRRRRGDDSFLRFRYASARRRGLMQQASGDAL